MTEPIHSITATEFEDRRDAVARRLAAAGHDALILFGAARVTYLTGFRHVSTERPIALVLDRAGRLKLVVPRVEAEHATLSTGIPSADLVIVYPEYPGLEHPMRFVADAVERLVSPTARVAADHDGYVPMWGYRGPTASEAIGRPLAIDADIVDHERRTKSPAELACIRTAGDWLSRAHRRMHHRIQVGRTDTDSYLPALCESVDEMIRSIPGWSPGGYEGSGLACSFVAGPSTAMAHRFVRGRAVQPGDVVVSAAIGDVGGYKCELERTMVVGTPSDDFVTAFNDVRALQQCAFDCLAPGRPVAEIDRAVTRLANDLGRSDCMRHHVGHSLGLERHESPFIDQGDDAVLEPGMVFTIEPGLYLPELGGIRHSDTVCITDAGHEIVTPYPSELEELIISSHP